MRGNAFGTELTEQVAPNASANLGGLTFDAWVARRRETKVEENFN